MPKTAIAENSSFETINIWVNNPDAPELSPKDRAIYERWDYAYDQLKRCTPQEVVSRLVKKFNITPKTARIDVKQSMELFAPINRTEAEWLERFIIEQTKFIYSQSLQNNDLKNANLAMNTLSRIYMHIKDNQKAIDPSMLGNNNYFIISMHNNNSLQKIDIDKLALMPANKRHTLEELFPDIEIQDAELILETRQQ